MTLTNAKTYSEVNGEKRKPERVKPNMVYDESSEFLTDKQAELIIVQHKLMKEFLSKKNLVDEFNQFQKSKQTRSTGVYAQWFKKWN